MSTMENDISANAWIFSNVIQLYYSLEQKVPLTYFYEGITSNPSKYIPIFDKQSFNIKTISNNTIDIIDLIMYCLNDGYYFTTTVDEFYIPNRVVYNKTHFSHGIMVYGYDPKAQVLYTAGYDVTNHYKFPNEVSFEAFKKAFKNNGRPEENIFIFKRNNKTYEFDCLQVRELLSDYLHSKNTSTRLSILQNPLEGYKFGISVYTYLKELIYNHKAGYKRVDWRPFYVIWEHKKCMIERIKYMYNTKHLLHADTLYQQFINIEKCARIILDLYIKYSITLNIEILDRVNSHIDNLIISEKKALELFISLIVE